MVMCLKIWYNAVVCKCVDNAGDLSMDISDSKKTLMAKLFFLDPDRYEKMIVQSNISLDEIWPYIEREQNRRQSLQDVRLRAKQIFPSRSLSPEPQRNNTSAKTNPSPRTGSRHKICILVDGDNHPFDNMIGFEKVRNRSDVSITIFVADDGLKRKYENRYGSYVEIQMVPAGDQAVDNRIKSIAGNKARSREFKRIAIVSRDKGYGERIQHWKLEYELGDNKIKLCHNVEKALL